MSVEGERELIKGTPPGTDRPGAVSKNLPEINDLLAEALKAAASDLHLKVGVPPMLRVDGELRATSHPVLSEDDTEAYLDCLLPDRLRAEFDQTHESDFSAGFEGMGRFRVNAYCQRGVVSIAIRPVPPAGTNFEDLGLPPVLGRLIQEPRGLILVTGPTGCGKSTTLAAMVDAINRTRRVNVITIEDPIEVIHEDCMALVHQREVGSDTKGFAEALRRVLRQDPDVILIGEMRDLPTIDAALKAAETGHLVLSTLHTLDATETINRILDFYTGGLQRQVRLLLAGTLKAIVSQRLIPRADHNGRVPAVEVLINTDRVAERITDRSSTHEIADIIAGGAYYGMETFDQSILRLFANGSITLVEALRNASRPADLRLRLQQLGLVPT
jgi:twitching motility protein PilT